MAATRAFISTAALLAIACASLTACSGGGTPTAGGGTHAPVASSSATPPTSSGSPSAVPSSSAPSSSATPGGSTGGTGGAGGGTPQCGNDDIQIAWGHGNMGQPLGIQAVLFTNVSDHVCSLQGYPGATIVDGTTVINAARVLNGDIGEKPTLTGPPLVILGPGGIAHAEIGSRVSDGRHRCYPTGSGAMEFTAPNTTRTVTLSYGHIGRQGICWNFETNPVRPGSLFRGY